MPVMRFFVLLIACLFGTAASAETHPWRLADADQISSTGYLILTVPMADDETLSAVATGIEKRYDVNLAAEWPLRAITVHCLVVDIRGHSDIEALIKRMRSDKTIRTVQKMQEFEVFESSSFEGLYSDPLLPSQLAMRQLNAVKAHLQSTGEGIRIGVVDSRIDEAHPDLSNRLFDARDFVSKEIDTIGEPHGTAIAGIIGADGANAAGIVGVAPGAELVGLRACWQEADMPGRCSSFSLARSLNFAILNGIKILNLSLGGPPDPLLEELVISAMKQGTVVVAAWGESNMASFPASLPGVIAAGRRKHGGIPAPYIDVISTAPGGRYRFVTGSSVAAAHVSGVVALMLASRSDLDAREIARVLSGALMEQEGGPLLDACVALQAVTGEQAACPG